MRPARWTSWETRLLRRHFGTKSYGELASMIGRTEAAIHCKCVNLRLLTRKLYTPAEVQYVRDHRDDPLAKVAAALGRNVVSINNLRSRLKLNMCPPKVGNRPGALETIRSKAAEGYSDADISKLLGCTREAVGKWRRRMGIPSQRFSDRSRRKVAENTKKQCAAAGVKSLGQIRVLAFQKYATKYGLPKDLRPRAVQMYLMLAKHGPMTRRQLCEKLKMAWHGVRGSLKANGQYPSYLSELIHKGLVVSLGRVVKGENGRGKGYTTNLYTIPLLSMRSTA